MCLTSRSGVLSQKVTFSMSSLVAASSDSRNELPDDLSPYIRFIDLDVLCTCDGFPRCPDHIQKTSLLSEINRDESLLVFISHCWLRPCSECEDWDGQDHPDNLKKEKWKLCCDGLRQQLQYAASRMKKCYVWLDYSCIDQDNRANMHKVFKCYDRIVGYCDAIFTPIGDSLYDLERLPGDSLAIYRATLFHGDHPQAYLSRAWCRVEMLYAANIPVIGNSNGVPRHTLFDAGLAIACRTNKRPHWLYGSCDVGVIGPHTLVPMNVNYHSWHPLQGNLTKQSDKEHIEELLADLQPYIDANNASHAYEGDVNDEGVPHGYGTRRFPHGEVYEGDWKNGVIEGRGCYVYADGSCYEGEWVAGNKHGRGIHTYANGDVYEGEYRDNQRHGVGTHRFVRGDVFEGLFVEGVREGPGRYRDSLGNEFEGMYKNDVREGPGVMKYANGNVFEGEFKEDTKNGPGKWTWISGTVEEGVWVNNNKHGEFVVHYSDGEVWDIIFVHGEDIMAMPRVEV